VCVSVGLQTGSTGSSMSPGVMALVLAIMLHLLLLPALVSRSSHLLPAAAV